MKKHYLKLAPTEQSLLNASATIFSAFVAAGKCPEGQEKEVAAKSSSIAIMMAEQIDRNVVADDEIG